MIKFVISVLLVISSLTSFSQTPSYSKIDDHVQTFGALEKFNVAIITDTITSNFPDKRDKARAIFYWIANNIAIDPKATRANDNKKVDPVIVLEARKATPLGFANLFQEMSSLAGIRCLVVDGYVKNYAEEINNKADEINHSWNVVQLGQSPEQWFYVDATKASGFLDKKMSVFTKQFTSNYFFANKPLFNLDHYPDNQAWLLGGENKSLSAFYALPVISSTAYDIGLQKPMPANGYIKTKITSNVSFSFTHDPGVVISNISLIIGEGNKQSKPEPMNFTDSDGLVKFTYKFKKADTYPVKIEVGGKELLQYFLEVEE